MVDKYRMSQEDNIFYAKRNIVDNIFKSARLEGIAITFPETQVIYEGRSVANLSVEDIIKINNLKHAWQFLFDSIDYPVDLRYIRQMNQEIESGLIHNAGVLRNTGVSIGGTSWKPDIPDKTNIESELDKILSIKNTTDRAITVMLYIMRSQMFLDGNKRTGQLVANQIMIQNGAGIISIPVDFQKRFFEELIIFYETNNNAKITCYIYEYCIDGFHVNQKREQDEEINREMFIKKNR